MKTLGFSLIIIPAVLWMLGWFTASLWAAAKGYANTDMGNLAAGLFFTTMGIAAWCAAIGTFLVWWSTR